MMSDKNNLCTASVHKLGIYSLRGIACPEFEANWGDLSGRRAPVSFKSGANEPSLWINPIYHEGVTFTFTHEKWKSRVQIVLMSV